MFITCSQTAIQLLEELLAILYEKCSPLIDFERASTFFNKHIRSLHLVTTDDLSIYKEESFLRAASLICKVPYNSISSGQLRFTIYVFCKINLQILFNSVFCCFLCRTFSRWKFPLDIMACKKCIFSKISAVFSNCEIWKYRRQTWMTPACALSESPASNWGSSLKIIRVFLCIVKYFATQKFRRLQMRCYGSRNSAFVLSRKWPSWMYTYPTNVYRMHTRHAPRS